MLGKSARFDSTNGLILTLALSKLLVHLFTATNYGLHRDAFLYLAQSRHLDWGYISVPPGIAVIGKISHLLLGDSVLAVRFFPALIGAIAVMVIGKMIKELDGSAWAIAIGCLAFILSPAYLRTNSLFQPVSFNQFFWLFSFYFIIKLLKSENPKYWIHLGILWGIAFLTKYSIAFLVLAFFISLLISSKRILLKNKEAIVGAVLALLIIAPNIYWQYVHNWPIAMHMQELRETQLVHVSIGGFFVMQMLMNFTGIFVWIAGLLFLFFDKSMQKQRVVGWIFLAVVGILLLLSGKAYYTLGAYPVLFAAGGVAGEKYLKGKFNVLKPVIIAIMAVLLWGILPLSLPIYSHARLIEWGKTAKQRGLEGAFTWEDGRIYDVPQDYADMTGWDEMAEIVIKKWQSLSPTEKQHCLVSADNYGQAGALLYFGKKHGLPDPICWNGSFVFWAPDFIDSAEMLITITDDTAGVQYFFNKIERIGQLDNPYARENGQPVYFCSEPVNGAYSFYKTMAAERKGMYRR